MSNEDNEYYLWRRNQFSENIGFFPIFSDFKPYLSQLSSGAIALYLYIGLYSNYKTGKSFHSIKKMSIYFDRSTRTISNWIKELEEAKLILRKQERLNGVAHTYLQPYNWKPGHIEINDR